MSLEGFILGVQWMFLCYFLVLNGGYLALNVVSLVVMRRYMAYRTLDSLHRLGSGFEPPVTVIVPAYNEERGIASSVHSLLQLTYPEYEVLVVNDGSTDGTLEVLRRTFDLVPFPEAYRVRLASRPVRGFYVSRRFSNLRVIDKDNGGKADSQNAAINAARYPLFCTLDADSILQRDSLLRVVQPFLDDPRTVASGGTVRIANGSVIRDGFLVQARLPRNPLALIQVAEYLRAFLFGRLGWSPMNALLIVSGAFGVFRKETVVEVGGYRSDTLGEDMELVVRMHRVLRQRGEPYRVTFVPDPICWTEAPEDLATLRTQRVRWQRGLHESLMWNRGLLFHRRGGAAGWLSFPFFAFFEWIGPLIEVLGFVVLTLGLALGLIALEGFLVLLAVAVGLGLVLSVTALLLEEISFRVYRNPGDMLRLFAVALLENFGYRQINAWWRLVGLVQALTGRKAVWGKMKRSGSLGPGAPLD